MKIATALAALLLLAGCAEPLPDMKADRSIPKHTYHLAIDHQLAYRHIVTMARDCWGGTSFFAQSGVDTDYFADIGLGEVTLYMNGPQGKLIHANVEIRKAHPGTELVVMAQYSGKDLDFVGWAKGGKACVKS